MAAILPFVASNISSFAVIAASVVVLIVVILFKSAIQGAIERWNNSSPKANDDTKPLLQNELQKGARPIVLIPDSDESRSRIDNLRTVLNSSSHSTEEKLDICLIDLANKDVRLGYEILFRTIYCSQFEALSALRKNGPLPLSSFYSDFLMRVGETFPDPPPKGQITFEAWVGFLASREHPLLIVEGGIATITRNGSEFLRYIASWTAGPSSPPRGL